MALDFTLLKKEQIEGDEALDVMKKYGKEVAPTDLAVLLGANMIYGAYSYHRAYGNCISCLVWSPQSDAGTYVHCSSGIKVKPHVRAVGVRPALPPSETAKITPGVTKRVRSVDIVEYGEYPQTVADEGKSNKLEELLDFGTLKITGKNYTFDSAGLKDHDTGFQASTYPEYEYDGKKYIHVIARPANNYGCLSNGGKVKRNGSYWVRVEPVQWLVDKSGTWVSRKCLFAGLQFDEKYNYDGNFENTTIKKYLNTYFSKEVEPSVLESERQAKKQEEFLNGLSGKLAEVSDLEKVKGTITPARTPERTDILARILRVRRAKEILSDAAQKAHKEGNKKMLRKIIEMAKPYAAREAAIRNKFHQKRIERRVNKDRR